MEKPLIVFEMANNHMGDLNHGIKLIKSFSDATRTFRDRFSFAFKLQYRDLDTFIHPLSKGREDVKYVKRFESTKLSSDAFLTLLSCMREFNFTTMCTPFDERSVDLIEKHQIEIIKIASCSFTDWPLLERIALTNKPIIASTAAASLQEVDSVVSFFTHRNKDLTILHCVAEYPTAEEKLNINQIDLLKTRYPDIKIGFSTHEDPNLTDSIMIALAKGAAVLEKHVGLPTDGHSNNAYSASPGQVSKWLEAGERALIMMGPTERPEPSKEERESLISLRRGAFAKRDLPSGHVLTSDDIFFAFPSKAGQVSANDWSKYSKFKLTGPINSMDPVIEGEVEATHLRELVLQNVNLVRDLLKKSGVSLPGKTDLELSHHYGIEKFGEYGLTMLTVVNRAYCKKILLLLPGQSHPEQYHKIKEETFVVLHGAMSVTLDGVEHVIKTGDVLTVEKGVRHKMKTDEGCVFEEISSTHHKSDSYYTDPAVAANLNRKTLLTYWM
jgi:sialic acid synthase SpsE/mannose-6-phosphate isomerase-like protein (cupin superfamily)